MLHHVDTGEGIPVLIFHGATLDHRHMMESLEPVFAERPGWRRIYVDLPGHGQSPPRDSIRTQDDLLSAVMDFATDILGDARFAIAGESRGSYVAQGMIHLNPAPVIGAALIVPGGSPSADPDRLPPHQVFVTDPDLWVEMSLDERKWMGGFHVVQNSAILKKMRRTKHPARALCDQDQADRVNANFDFSFHRLGERTDFDGPSVIIAGRQDSLSGYLDAMDLVAGFSRASLAVLDTAGHGVAWERPELFNALVVDWLQRMEPSV
jgi:pimeloyl-ACP methyl ester carboxylesterase